MRRFDPTFPAPRPPATDLAAEAATLDALGLAACRVDTEGRIQWLNRHFTALLGWSEVDALGHQAADFLHPDDRPAWRAWWGTTGERTPLPAPSRAHLRHADSRFRPAQLRIAPHPAAWTVVFIPDHPAAGSASGERKESPLPRDFEALAGHELRSPLNAILGLSDSLLEAGPALPSERQQHYLRMIRDGGRRLLNSVERLRELSRIERGLVLETPAPCDFIMVLRRSLAGLPAQHAGRMAALQIDLPPTPMPMLLPAGLLSRAIGLLVSRELELATGTETIHLSVRQADGSVTLSLARQAAAGAAGGAADDAPTPPDGGAGLPPARALSLALAASLVHRSGGHLTHHRRPNGDSLVCIVLDASPHQPAAKPAS